MKRFHIIGLIIVAVAVATIVAAIGNTNTYGSFKEAESNPDEIYTVSGYLNKEKEIIEKTNLLIFYMYDKDSTERKVILNQTKPRDFERSTTVVVTGTSHGKEFHATDIQMKCPSKYNEKNT
jgi:cytochrome c-type biogenesis protein CcmE